MLRTMLLATVGALALTVPSIAQESTKIRVGCTSTSDCGSAMLAVDSGIFKRLGLDVEMVRIALNSTIPPALLSNSLEIGGPTSSVFLQAVDGGLDLVALAGASRMYENVNKNVFAIVRTGVDIKSPKDFVGKKVGVPGFGAYLHILFLRYLMAGGVDPADVNFVETTFPSMPDVIRTAAVDAVLAGSGPTTETIVGAGTGSVGPSYIAELGGDGPVIFYASTRAWAEANPEIVEKFRQGIAEAAEIANSDWENVVPSIANFTQQDVAKVRIGTPPKFDANITAEDLDWWLELMREQGLLQGDVNAADHIAK